MSGFREPGGREEIPGVGPGQARPAIGDEVQPFRNEGGRFEPPPRPPTARELAAQRHQERLEALEAANEDAWEESLVKRDKAIRQRAADHFATDQVGMADLGGAVDEMQRRLGGFDDAFVAARTRENPVETLIDAGELARQVASVPDGVTPREAYEEVRRLMGEPDTLKRLEAEPAFKRFWQGLNAIASRYDRRPL